MKDKCLIILSMLVILAGCKKHGYELGQNPGNLANSRDLMMKMFFL
jgi:hypothetical protein